MLKFTRDGQVPPEDRRAGHRSATIDTRTSNRPANVVVDPATQRALRRRRLRQPPRDRLRRRHRRLQAPLGRQRPAARRHRRVKGFGNPVHCIRLSRDGLVYVCDRANNRIQVFRKDGSFVREFVVAPETRGNGSTWDLDLSPDARQTHPLHGGRREQPGVAAAARERARCSAASAARAHRRAVPLGPQHGRRLGRQRLHDRGRQRQARAEVHPEVPAMTDEQKRIRGYLVAQGAKLAPGEIVEKVRAAMGDLRAAALTVPAARFDERPEPEEWSANEVLAHVVDAGRHFGDAIVRHPRRPAGRRRSRPAGARRAAPQPGGVVGAARDRSERPVRPRRERRPAGPARRHRGALRSSARSTGGRRCCSCACTTSTTPASSRRSRPRWPRRGAPDARRHRPPPGDRRRLGQAADYVDGGRAARRRLRLVRTSRGGSTPPRRWPSWRRAPRAIRLGLGDHAGRHAHARAAGDDRA